MTPAFLDGPGYRIREMSRLPAFTGLADKLCDVGDKRISEMDAAGIDMQIMSLNSPGVEQLEASASVETARETNDTLARAIESHPARFAGFAALPTPAPERAADELERVVSQYGFKGGFINGHSRGRYLDDTFFWPILERAELLGVPLYIHPTPPPEPVTKSYYTGNFSQEVSARLSTAAWGWHIETAIHVIRLILSGAFDKYPKLQVVIGHLGESLPFMLPRINTNLPTQLTKLQKSLGAYLRENVHYTPSGFNYTPAFMDLLFEVGVDRIMFSSDYPYWSMQLACDFLDHLPLSPLDKEKIAHGNAERLFRV